MKYDDAGSSTQVDHTTQAFPPAFHERLFMRSNFMEKEHKNGFSLAVEQRFFDNLNFFKQLLLYRFLHGDQFFDLFE